MRLYRVLLVGPDQQGAPAVRLRDRLTAHGLRVDGAGELGRGEPGMGELGRGEPGMGESSAAGALDPTAALSGYSALVVLPGAPDGVEPWVRVARAAGRPVLDLRVADPSPHQVDDWARSVLPPHER